MRRLRDIFNKIRSTVQTQVKMSTRTAGYVIKMLHEGK